jgi:hypothetical protein
MDLMDLIEFCLLSGYSRAEEFFDIFFLAAVLSFPM